MTALTEQQICRGYYIERFQRSKTRPLSLNLSAQVCAYQLTLCKLSIPKDVNTAASVNVADNNF